MSIWTPIIIDGVMFLRTKEVKDEEYNVCASGQEGQLALLCNHVKYAQGHFKSILGSVCISGKV